MPDDPYHRLRSYLDQLPLGFPETPSGLEIKILKKMFSEEEAEAALWVTPFPEEARQIAERTGVALDGLEARLEAMSRKGLLFRFRRRGQTLFQTAPFMIGLYEYSVQRMDRELADLCRRYYEEAYQEELGASNVPGFKVIPIDQRVPADLVLFPHVKVAEEIRAARKIAVAECVCRKEATLTGHNCGSPRETCLSFGVAAEYYIENKIGREIDAEEALAILEQADRAGLVHAGANTRHLSNICNCCPCCCASLKGIVSKGHDKRKYLNALYEAVVDPEACLVCEACSERCPVQAIIVEEIARVDRDRCLGCGLCAGVCPSDALMLKLREDRQEPFRNILEMGLAILEGKRRWNRSPAFGRAARIRNFRSKE
ncbi:MAG: 4Fe-4S binding protein [Deltaproteobacteria bacterium]|nr:4Fe-4S binding protein [Deltaproteobacteria bacterium]